MVQNSYCFILSIKKNVEINTNKISVMYLIRKRKKVEDFPPDLLDFDGSLNKLSRSRHMLSTPISVFSCEITGKMKHKITPI